MLSSEDCLAGRVLGEAIVSLDDAEPIEEAIDKGGVLCGSPAEIVEHLKKLEVAYPGLSRISVSLSVGVPQAVALEQLERFATEVMPAFKTAAAEPAVVD